MFQRVVSIDWSGASTDDARVALRVVEASMPNTGRVVAPPNAKPGVRRWSRTDAFNYLKTLLRPGQAQTLVAIDFGFGLPWGADRALFDCNGWRATVDRIAELYGQHGTARATAEFISSDQRFQGHGPYRFNESRNDARFYFNHGVAYYRLVELAVPQAISQWYLGAGGAVGFHTISGLATISRLLARRDYGELDFVVWPQEVLEPPPDRHLLVESYPAIYPTPQDFGPCVDDDQRDAWRVLDWILNASASESLAAAFSIPQLAFGRYEGVNFWDQVRFEGWILGAG